MAVLSLLWSSELAQTGVSVILVLVVVLGGPVEALQWIWGVIFGFGGSRSATSSTAVAKCKNIANASRPPVQAIATITTTCEASASPRQSLQLRTQDRNSLDAAAAAKPLYTPESLRTDAAVIQEKRDKKERKAATNKKKEEQQQYVLENNHSSRRDMLMNDDSNSRRDLLLRQHRPKYGRANSETIRATAAAARELNQSRRSLMNNSGHYSMNDMAMTMSNSSRHRSSERRSHVSMGGIPDGLAETSGSTVIRHSEQQHQQRGHIKFHQSVKHSAVAAYLTATNAYSAQNDSSGVDHEESIQDIFAAIKEHPHREHDGHDNVDDNSEGSLDFFADDQFNSDPTLRFCQAQARRSLQQRTLPMSKSENFLDFNDSFRSSAGVRTTRSSFRNVRSISTNLKSKMKRHAKSPLARPRNNPTSPTSNRQLSASSSALNYHHNNSNHYKAGMAVFNNRNINGHASFNAVRGHSSLSNLARAAATSGGHDSFSRPATSARPDLIRDRSSRRGASPLRSGSARLSPNKARTTITRSSSHRYSTADQRILDRLYAPPTTEKLTRKKKKSRSSRKLLTMDKRHSAEY